MANSLSRHVEPLLPGGDAGTAKLSLTVSGFDTVAEDNATETLALTPSGIEVKGFEYLDSNTEVFTFTVGSVEEAIVGSTGTLNFKFTPFGVDVTNVNVGTLDFKLVPSVVEVKDTNDAAEEYFDLQPGGVEAPQYPLVEVTTVPLKFTPSGTDTLAHEYTDSVSALLALTATGLEVYCRYSPQLSAEAFSRFGVENRSRMAVLEDIHWEFDVLEGVDPCLPPVEAFLV